MLPFYSVSCADCVGFAFSLRLTPCTPRQRRRRGALRGRHPDSRSIFPGGTAPPAGTGGAGHGTPRCSRPPTRRPSPVPGQAALRSGDGRNLHISRFSRRWHTAGVPGVRRISWWRSVPGCVCRCPSMCWYSVPPSATLIAWMPRQMPRIGFPESYTAGNMANSKSSVPRRSPRCRTAYFPRTVPGLRPCRRSTGSRHSYSRIPVFFPGLWYTAM